jgi:ubiquinone/menaquinone biosynthesis C-methylase UbiE
MLMDGVPDESFDFVYSSHCLEHVHEVPHALRNWLRILKPGGYLYVVVPDYLLYEKLTFPSRHNSDHKHSFSLDIPRARTRRENHWTTIELGPYLPQLIEAFVEDDGFDWSRGTEDQTMGDALCQICIVARKQ